MTSSPMIRTCRAGLPLSRLYKSAVLFGFTTPAGKELDHLPNRPVMLRADLCHNQLDSENSRAIISEPEALAETPSVRDKA